MKKSVLLTLGLEMDNGYTEDFMNAIEAFNEAINYCIEPVTRGQDRNVICITFRVSAKPCKKLARQYLAAMINGLIKSYESFTGADGEAMLKFTRGLSIVYSQWFSVSKPHELNAEFFSD